MLSTETDSFFSLESNKQELGEKTTTEKKKKISFDLIQKIVLVRNEPEIIAAFKENTDKAHMIRSLCNTEAKKVKASYSGKQCSVKYNNLIRDCRKNIVISQKTGQGKMEWIYWDLMREHGVSGKEILPPSVEDTKKTIQF
jgi:hypothetical protein